MKKSYYESFSSAPLFFLGVSLVLIFEWGLAYGVIPFDEDSQFFSSVFFLVLVGFYIRIIRRWTFFRGQTTFHACLTFESIFQCSVLVNPRISYPDFEAAFLKREIFTEKNKIMHWFHVRTLSSIAIPSSLMALILWYSNWRYVGVFLGLGIVALMFFFIKITNWSRAQTIRLIQALVLGVIAVFTEAFFYYQASSAGSVSSSLICYFVVLSIYELTPIPFALGVIECGMGILFLFFGINIQTLLLPLTYRLARGGLVLILCVFYLPRYKLKFRDLFNPFLSLTLEPQWKKERELSGVKPTCELSIIIPAYNEADRLPKYLPKIVRYCKEHGRSYEIIIVDDGSKDGTVDYLEKVSKEIRIIKQQENMGKGAAVKRGVSEAKGEYILFVDADGATPIEEAEKLLDLAHQGADIVIATRKLVKRYSLRGFLSIVFYRITNLLAVPGISDTQCGFKLFHHKAAKFLFEKSLEIGWAFDVEILFLAQKLGIPIVEVPVRWEAVKGSKVNPIQDGIKMFLAILRIRRRWAGAVDVIYES